MATITIPDIDAHDDYNAAVDAAMAAKAMIDDALIVWGAMALGKIYERFPRLVAIGFESGVDHPIVGLTYPDDDGIYSLHAVAQRERRGMRLPLEIQDEAWAIEKIFIQWGEDDRFAPLSAAVRSVGSSGGRLHSWLPKRTQVLASESEPAPHRVHAKIMLEAIGRSDLWAKAEASALNGSAEPAQAAKPAARM